jgi:cardiolipin synthase
MADPLLSVHFDRIRMRLSSIGCDVREFRPFGPGSLWSLSYRNHRRMVIVDGQVALVGGFGVWRSWEGDVRTPEEWRDVDVRIQGPSVTALQQHFAADWQEAGGPLLPPEAFPEVQAEGGAKVAFVASRGDINLSQNDRMFQLLIASAHRRLWIANSYFIPSTAIVKALVAKAKEGVDVRVLVPGKMHDEKPVRLAQLSTYGPLLEGGVRIYEYGPAMMHAKTVLVDEQFVEVGSSNLDPLSLKRNLEICAVIQDRDLALQYGADFATDLSHAREILVTTWRRRDLVDRFVQSLPSAIGEYL